MDAIDEASGRPLTHEPRWQAAVAVVVAVALYITLPPKLTYGPIWILPLLEAALLPPLLFATGHPFRRQSRWERLVFLALGEDSPLQHFGTIVLIGLINAANVLSLALLGYHLAHGAKATGHELIISAIPIWLTNIIVFALWYWQLDRGGPGARGQVDEGRPDFLFPQMATPDAAPRGWTPRLLDYLYVAFTNATAFSPTDTMPLSKVAKALMTVQALVSLLLSILVLSRAVNILT